MDDERVLSNHRVLRMKIEVAGDKGKSMGRALGAIRRVQEIARNEEEVSRSWEKVAKSLSEEERLMAFAIMVDRELWYWMPVISYEMGRGLGEPRFREMLRHLSCKMDGKLAGEIYWEGLVDAGERLPHEAARTAQWMVEDEGGVGSALASALMAGMARVRKEDSMELFEKLLRSEDSIPAALRGINITLMDESLSPGHVGPLALSIELPEDPETQSIYSLTLRLVHSFAPERVERIFMKLIESAPQWVRDQALYDLGVIPGLSEETIRWLEEQKS